MNKKTTYVTSSFIGNKKKIVEKDYGKLKGTKVYYFIKNTLEKNPILLYL